MLDQFLGSGTTLVEAKLLGRNAIGVDINPEAVLLAKKNLNFPFDDSSKTFVREGNALELDFVGSERIDFICTHPPYADIIRYSDNIPNDLSLLNADSFLEKMHKVALTSCRVLKKEKFCAVMMGDIRKKGRIVPLGFQVMNCFLEQGFTLKELIIKEQHNCRSTTYWSESNSAFLLLAHEYIFVFQK